MANLPPMISPRFLTVEDDLLSLKILGLSTVTDLTLAHKKLQAPAWHLIEKTKKYDKLLKLFGAATELGSLRVLLDALIRRKSWRSLLILQEAEVVLEKSKAADCFFQI